MKVGKGCGKFTVLLIVTAIAFWLSPLKATKAGETVQTINEAIEDLASDIAAHLGESERSLAVDSFGGPAGSSTGRLLQTSLQNALQKHGFEKDLVGSSLAVRGNFSVSFEHDGTIILIESQLVDRTGKGRGQFRKYAFAAGAKSLEEVAKLFPSNVDFADSANQASDSSSPSTNATKETKSAEKKQSGSVSSVTKQKQSVQSPTFVFQDPGRTRISPTRSSRFHMELLVKRRGDTDYRSFSFTDAGGIPFAEMKQGDEFRIQVYNLADHPIGVKLLIDGLNSLQLSHNAEMIEHGCWLIHANSVASIKGWYIDAEHIRPFVVTAQDRNLPFPDASDIGTVSALIFRATMVYDRKTDLRDHYASTRSFPIRITAGDLQVNSTDEAKAIFDSEMLASLSFRYTIPTDLPKVAPTR